MNPWKDMPHDLCRLINACMDDLKDWQTRLVVADYYEDLGMTQNAQMWRMRALKLKLDANHH